MEDRSNEDLSKLLETIQQVTKTYAQSVPKPEDIARITEAYAQLYPNVQRSATLAQSYEAYTAGIDPVKNAFPVPTQEQIAQMREAAARLIPVEELQSVQQVAAHASPEAQEMLRAVANALGTSGTSSFQKAGEPASDALIALQRALEGKHAPAPATFDPSVRTDDRPRSIWKAVYLALGVMIVVGLILTLVVPEFRDALQGLFR